MHQDKLLLQLNVFPIYPENLVTDTWSVNYVLHTDGLACVFWRTWKCFLGHQSVLE